MKTSDGYTGGQIALHWIIAALIAANYFLGEGMGWAFRQMLEKGAQPGLRATLHIWIGIAVFVLVLVRIVLRLREGAPPQPETTPALLRFASSAGHLLLYVMMIGVPLGGMIAWFGGVREVAELHELGGNLIILVAGLHAVAALFHQYVLKDRLLLRMMRPR